MAVKIIVTLVTITMVTAAEDNKPLLNLPKPELCANRPQHHFFNGHKYAFSWRVPDAGSRTWFFARNWCRDRCMDLVSMETGQENEEMKRIVGREVPRGQSVWTSGRLCNFNDDCKRPDLQPIKVNGWFWATPRIRMLPSDQRGPFRNPRGVVNDWSSRGQCGAQPDQCNQRFDEACMSVGNNLFNDGIGWHDETCEDRQKAFICEDSDELVNFVRFNNRHLNI